MRRALLPGGVLGLVPLLFAACGDGPPSTYKALPELRAELDAFGLVPEADDVEMAALAWQAPASTCPHVYRVHARYEPELMHESDNDNTLALGLVPDKAPPAFAGAPPPAGETVTLRLFYQGFRAEKRGTARDVFVSAEQIGPSAPTAACTPRTWDPMEDALALAWPRLPARLAAVDEHWSGSRVEGRCNRSACVDPNTGGGGPDNHGRTCVTMSWDERLAGVFDVGDERFALVESRWSDGQPDGKGISAHRLALVSIDHGRPAWARAVITHPFPQMTADKRQAPVVRTWTLEAVDACPGSLAAAGWVRPDDVVAEHDRAIASLAKSDELKRRDEESKRKADAVERDPFAPPPSPPANQ